MTIRPFAVGVVVVLALFALWLTGPMDLVSWVAALVGLYLFADGLLNGPVRRWLARRFG